MADKGMGGRIRELRKRHGMSLEGLGDSAGISPAHLSRIERNKAEPSFTVAARIADGLGVSLSELAGLVDFPTDVGDPCPG